MACLWCGRSCRGLEYGRWGYITPGRFIDLPEVLFFDNHHINSLHSLLDPFAMSKGDESDHKAACIEAKERERYQHASCKTHLIVGRILLRVIVLLTFTKGEILEVEIFDELLERMSTLEGMTKRRRRELQRRAKS